MNDATVSSTRGTLLAALLLVVAMAAVFGQAYRHEFLVWDDDKHVLENPQLNPPSWHGVVQFWRKPYWGLYVPLSYTFFAAEASIAHQASSDGGSRGLDPAVFHLGNLALHVVCVLLVFVVLRRLFRHTWAAWAGAMLFGLHPVQVESVAWISETRGVLCGVFSLTAIWLYLCHADSDLRVPTADGGQVAARPSAARPFAARPFAARSSAAAIALYCGAFVAFVLALLSKPAAVAVPLVVGALDVGLLRRPLRRVLLGLCPWLILACGWVVLVKLQQPDRQLPFVAPLWARPLLAGDALAFYGLKILAPLRLGPDYGRTPAWVMGQWWFYVAWLLPSSVLVLLASLRNRRIWLTAAAVWAAWLLPVLGFVPFVFQRISTVADRYLYLALLGPALALSWFLARRCNRWTVKLTVGLTGVALGLLGVASFVQTAQWRNNETLLAQGLSVHPDSVVARHNHGHLLAVQGQHAEAVERFRETLRDHPDHAELYLSLASSLVALHQVDAAVDVMREAAGRFPNEPLVYCQLGIVLARQGATEEAEQAYHRALELDRDCAAAHLHLGSLLMERREVEAAVEHYRRVIQIAPNHVAARISLGAALRRLGRPDEARHHYRAALEMDARSAAAHYNLGILLAEEGSLNEAVEHYRSALRFDPGHARAHVNLGIVLFEQGKTPEATEHFRRAVAIEPELAQAHLHLGRALAADGHDAEAEEELRAALRLVPSDSTMERQIRRLLLPYEGDEAP